MSYRRAVLMLVFCTTCDTIGAGEKLYQPKKFDWPQWQGPMRDNRSSETGLLKIWQKGGPPLVWKTHKVGGGYSAPTISAGRIFGMGYFANDEVVWALDENNGDVLWKKVIAKAYRKIDYREGSRCSPTVDGDFLYVIGVGGDVVCLHVDTGKIRWRKHLIRDFDGILPFYIRAYGFSESPLIDGDKVVVTPGGPKNTIVALHKKTGAKIWSASVPENGNKGTSRAAYASLRIGEIDGLRQYVQFLQGEIVGVAADDGRLLWRWDKPSNDIANCTTPLFFKNYIFASSGYGKGCGLAKFAREGKKLKLQEVYFNRAMKNVHGGLVRDGDYVYGNSDPGFLVCLHWPTGKVMWRSRQAGKGSVLLADRRLYYRDEDGPMLLVEATPKGYVEHGRFMPPHRSTANAWSHPVVANGRMYLRDQNALLSYLVKNK